jgi:hypothetical protein
MNKDWQPALAASTLLRYDAVRQATVLLLRFLERMADLGFVQ